MINIETAALHVHLSRQPADRSATGQETAWLVLEQGGRLLDVQLRTINRKRDA